MDIRPILSALLRNRTGAVLVGVQVAITLAVIANAFFVIAKRLELVHRPSGNDSANLIFVQSEGYGPEYQHVATMRADLALLRALPGVVAAAPSSSVPESDGGSSSGYLTSPDPKAPVTNANVMEVDPAFLDAYGLKLVAGRKFRPEEYVAEPANNDLPPLVMISESMAKRLYGDAPAVGRPVYDNGGKQGTIIGVVSDMLGSWPRNVRPGPYDIVYHATGGLGRSWRYVVRARLGERDRLIPEIEKRLNEIGNGRAVTWVRPHDFWLLRTFRPDRRMIVFLTTLVVMMTSVTALGIVGLATFHVNARRKQIGTRRALGARRADIVHYFLIENGLLSLAGIVTGALLAWAASGWLASAFQTPPLPAGYVGLAALALLVLGQLAVLWPARRAGAIEPAVATRTL
ncbi:MAG: ABC transporter permease [Proteobacteria bacterium]|nr:ABC transporter permease [Pseudomonadota bacterium]